MIGGPRPDLKSRALRGVEHDGFRFAKTGRAQHVGGGSALAAGGEDWRAIGDGATRRAGQMERVEPDGQKQIEHKTAARHGDAAALLQQS